MDLLIMRKIDDKTLPYVLGAYNAYDDLKK